jgi:hypothetical protein
MEQMQMEQLQMEQMDTDWVKQYEEETEKYNMFYEEPLRNITLYSVYVSKDKEIEEIKQSTLYLNTLNTIEKEDIIKVVSERNKKYKLSSIITYNMDLDTNNVKDFFFNSDKYNFINSYSSIDKIILKPSISFFQELNGLYIFFNEIAKDEKRKNTKKVLLSLSKPKTRKNKKF